MSEMVNILDVELEFEDLPDPFIVDSIEYDWRGDIITFRPIFELNDDHDDDCLLCSHNNTSNAASSNRVEYDIENIYDSTGHKLI